MFRIETIVNDIKDLTEHLDLMKWIIHSYSVVNETFVKNDVDLAKEFEIHIKNF